MKWLFVFVLFAGVAFSVDGTRVNLLRRSVARSSAATGLLAATAAKADFDDCTACFYEHTDSNREPDHMFCKINSALRNSVASKAAAGKWKCVPLQGGDLAQADCDTKSIAGRLQSCWNPTLALSGLDNAEPLNGAKRMRKAVDIPAAGQDADALIAQAQVKDAGANCVDNPDYSQTKWFKALQDQRPDGAVCMLLGTTTALAKHLKAVRASVKNCWVVAYNDGFFRGYDVFGAQGGVHDWSCKVKFLISRSLNVYFLLDELTLDWYNNRLVAGNYHTASMAPRPGPGRNGLITYWELAQVLSSDANFGKTIFWKGGAVKAFANRNPNTVLA